MKQIYLAAAWHRRGEAKILAEELDEVGVYVHSRWLWAQENTDPTQKERHMREMAFIDVQDIRSCDVFVRLADNHLWFGENQGMVPASFATGARMFEQGLAWALGKPIYVVGGKQMLFDRLPNIIHVKDKEQLKRELCPYTVQ